MSSDSNQTEKLHLEIRYSQEISEQITPGRNISEPVLGPVNYVKAEKSKINKVFYFMAFVSIACLGALMLVPQPVVEVAVGTIWAGALALSRYMMSPPHGDSGETRKE